MPEDSSDSPTDDVSTVIKEYYEGEVRLDAVADEHGEMTAIRVFLLKRSLDREPPMPAPENVEMPSDEEFYGDCVEEYIPDEG